jgi:formylglycine-generating enzyme required for sulfatase activity
MKPHAHLPVVAVLFAAFTLTSHSHAQSPLVTIDTVTVGDAGNAADTTTYGAVTDVFAIGKYEVTIGQYNTFLNSVASVTSDSYIVNLWNASMASNLNIAGISRSGSGTLGDPYSYSAIGSDTRPITYVSWFDAARFANWVNNGATLGASTETGAYTLNGATSGIFTVNPGATWFLPSEDQWYKAAYYKGGGTNAGYWVYPTQSDSAPGNNIGGAANQANYYADDYAVTQSPDYSDTQNYLTEAGVFSNSASAYGTFDQAGNVMEWNDAVISGSSRGTRGGSWGGPVFGLQSSFRNAGVAPTDELDFVGFRVASVPEPSTAILVLLGAGACIALRRWKATL